MALLRTRPLVPAEEYLDILFHADDDLLIPFSSLSANGYHCHTANALKVYRRDDRLVYRVVKYKKSDPSAYQYYSSRLEIKRKNRKCYKFSGEAGGRGFVLTFKISNQGCIAVTWQRVGYRADQLHVCFGHLSALLEAVNIQ